MILSQPGPFAQQVAAPDVDNRPQLAVLFKRTFVFNSTGACRTAPEQHPLTIEPTVKNPGGLVEMDSDLYHFKPTTDIIVHGHIHTRSRERAEASVSIGSARKRIVAIGPRVATSSGGRPRFSDPKPVDKVPLTYELAYGGIDQRWVKELGNPYVDVDPNIASKEADPIIMSPFSCPRNPVGRGYVLKDIPPGTEIPLPQLEDPDDLLTPERLLRRDCFDWLDTPIPTSLGWLSLGWFPRIGYTGLIPPVDPQPTTSPEVRRGWASEKLWSGKPPDARTFSRIACGASLGLTIPYVRPEETIRIQGLRPTEDSIDIRLPAERPKIRTDGRKGKLNDTDPVIHTIQIWPDTGTLSIVWRGSAPALRPYSNDELAKMPLQVEWPD